MKKYADLFLASLVTKWELYICVHDNTYRHQKCLFLLWKFKIHTILVSIWKSNDDKISPKCCNATFLMTKNYTFLIKTIASRIIPKGIFTKYWELHNKLKHLKHICCFSEIQLDIIKIIWLTMKHFSRLISFFAKCYNCSNS